MYFFLSKKREKKKKKKKKKKERIVSSNKPTAFLWHVSQQFFKQSSGKGHVTPRCSACTLYILPTILEVTVRDGQPQLSILKKNNNNKSNLVLINFFLFKKKHQQVFWQYFITCGAFFFYKIGLSQSFFYFF